MTLQPRKKEAVVELLAKDLNANGGVFCPSPKAGMKLWNTHPRIYLDVARTGEAKCAVLRHRLQAQGGRAFRRRPLIAPIGVRRPRLKGAPPAGASRFRGSPR